MKGEAEPLPLEVALVWALFLLDAVAILVTYSRLPAHELYHVSGSGLEGGLSRVLVDSNFPTALVAIAILLVLIDRLPGLRAVAVAGDRVVHAGVLARRRRRGEPRRAPGERDRGASVCSLHSSCRCSAGSDGWSRNARGDGFRDVIGTAAVLVSLPWLFAELGFFLDRVPLLDRVFETGEYRTRGMEVAVHHGHHHGLDGVLLLLTAILLSRVVPSIRARVPAPAARGVPLADGGLRPREHGERLLDGADLEARLDELAVPGPAAAVALGRLGR